MKAGLSERDAQREALMRAALFLALTDLTDTIEPRDRLVSC